MPVLAEVSRVFNTPQYGSLEGLLYTADWTSYPITSMIGELGNLRQSPQNRFNASVEYDLAAAVQPNITEDASLTAPTANTHSRTNVENVVQIFHESVNVSYDRQANPGLVQVPTGFESSTPNELDFQVARTMETIRRNVEFTAILGVYAAAANSAQSNRSRGLWNAVAAGNTIDAVGEVLSKGLLYELGRTMWENGATFRRPVLLATLAIIQKINDIFAYVPTSRTEGGSDITSVYIPGIGPVQLMPHRVLSEAQVEDELIIADMSYVFGVGQEVPGKGNFFMEELAKTGAAERWQVFGKWGLAHGPDFVHGKLTDFLLEPAP